MGGVLNGTSQSDGEGAAALANLTEKEQGPTKSFSSASPPGNMDDGLPAELSADLTEEDLLEVQRQFLAKKRADRQSGSAADRPAAAAVRVQPPQRPVIYGMGDVTI